MLSALFKRKQHAQANSHVSSGLWQLAMGRLKRDRIAMFSLCVVLFYFLLLILSMAGVIAKDWNKEVAVSYAPPTFIGATQNAETPKVIATVALPENPVDPLKDVIHTLNAEITAESSLTEAVDYYGITDPLAEDMNVINQQLGGIYWINRVS